MREETCCYHMGYFQLAATVLLYAPSHRQGSTYHDLCYTCHGAMAGMRNKQSEVNIFLIFTDPLHENYIQCLIIINKNMLSVLLNITYNMVIFIHCITKYNWMCNRCKNILNKETCMLIQ